MEFPSVMALVFHNRMNRTFSSELHRFPFASSSSLSPSPTPMIQPIRTISSSIPSIYHELYQQFCNAIDHSLNEDPFILSHSHEMPKKSNSIGIQNLPISKNERKQIENYLKICNGYQKNEIVISKFNLEIRRSDLQCLNPGTWLNDELINFWFNLLDMRDQNMVSRGKFARRSHFFNTFFFTRLFDFEKILYAYSNVRRWTKKIDIFSLDKVFVPINIRNVHWTLAVIYIQKRIIQYYDSLHSPGDDILRILLRYLQDESKNKKGKNLDMDTWKLIPASSIIPRQDNGYDCGVFVSSFAECISRNGAMDFSTSDMNHIRNIMLLSIVHGDFTKLDIV